MNEQFSIDVKKATEEIAKQYGVVLNSPKSNCKRCYGRGFLLETLSKTTIPCNCIFPKELKTIMKGKFNPVTRKTRRNFIKQMQKKPKRK